MSLQWKLNLIVTSLLLVLLGIASLFVLHNAREDVRAELASTSNVAMHLLDAEITRYEQMTAFSVMTKSAVASFRLERLGEIRHLHLDYYDPQGRLTQSVGTKTRGAHVDKPPTWFIKAMQLPNDEVLISQTREIIIGDVLQGKLVATPDPSDEINEVWRDYVDLLKLYVLLFVTVNLIIFFAVRYAFRPVAQIASALAEVERGKLNVRLPEFKQLELAAISKKFNAMASALERSVDDNHRLTQELIHLQERERKVLAREIHDEIGQYLAAIHVDAAAIMRAKNIKAARVSAEAIGEVARQMMDIVHHMLQKLRPRALDELGLSVALRDLVHGWRDRHRSVNMIISIANDLDNIDEAVAIVVYRVVQECLTNIAKHASANRVILNVYKQDNMVRMMIEDDGKGFNQENTTQGLGLSGMRERVQGMFGSLSVESVPGNGSRIQMLIPYQAA